MSVIFGFDPLITASVILVLTYVLVISDRFDRSLLALLGAGAMILAGILTQEEAIRGIDFNTIALLTGMMILVSVARRSGVFEFLAIASAQSVRASPAGVLCLLSLVTALLSGLLDNVTTVLLIAPVTLSIAQRLRVPPFPFLLAEIMASNIGGTATLIGDPPNIMIGSAAGLSFNAFVIDLAPVIVVVMAVQLLLTLGVPEDQRAEHALDVIKPARRPIARRALGELQRHQRLPGQRDPGHDRVHMADPGRLESGVRGGEQRDADRRGTTDVGDPAV